MPKWKKLFEEARTLVDDEEGRHATCCGCRDVGDPVVEGLCPGVKERVAFLDRTKHLAPNTGE